MPEPVEEVAPATGGIRVVIVDADGVPVRGARASLTGPRLPGVRDAVLDEQGRGVFRDLAPGVYFLEVHSDRFDRVRREFEVFGGRTTHANLTLHPRYGPWWEGRGLFRENEAQRGSFVRGEELRVLPVHSLGGVEAVARHPALGATWLASDVLWTEGRPYTPIAPEPAVSEIDPRGLALQSIGEADAGYGQLDARADGTGWRGVALLPVPLLASGGASFVGAFDAEPPRAGGYARVDVMPVRALHLTVRGVSGDRAVEAGASAALRPGGDFVLNASGGVLADLSAAPDAPRGYVGVGVAREGVSASNRPAVRAELLSNTPTLPAHARVTLEDPWDVTRRARVHPSVSWRRRGEEDVVEWGLSTAIDPVGTERGALFGGIRRRWEGIDTETFPLVRRDELVLGGGLSLDRAWRVKMSAQGAIRHDASGDLPADANLQLAVHRPSDNGWGLVAAVTWRPESPDLNAGAAPYEAGLLGTWMPDWSWVRPIVGVGAGVQAGQGPPRGQIAARLGVSVRAIGHNADFAVESALGDPGWSTAPTRDVREGAHAVTLSVRVW